MLAFAAFLALASAPSPAIAPSQRAGYPKVRGCPSIVARPDALPGLNDLCRAWRGTELSRIAALPMPARAARVEALRDMVGVQSGEGLDIMADGTLYAATGAPLAPAAD